ncbi:integral peroxisomal membrane peroxin-domain-containing protein [Lentinula aff. detonsa]|nr:integral peroxisomal membrane peroxin-domain-containing protein [Lentinula aff. detonsa]
MATLDYISIPSCASRLQFQPQPSLKSFRAHTANENDIRPAPKLRTSLPRPSAESSEGPTSPLKGFAGSSAFNLLPNLLLSSSFPSGSTPTSDPTASSDSKSNPGKKRFKKLHQEPVVLLSNKDPLSIQVTSVNFKRFIERVGPVFWLQDRIEEIVCWRRGWKLTGTWLAVYGFLCYFPRLVFVLPHIILIAIILAIFFDPPSAATPTESNTDATFSSTAETPLPAPVIEDSVDWQANIQAIQNLMGFYADIHIATTPYLNHLSLSPNNPQISKPRSPYTLPFLTILILTLPLSVFFVTSAIFPVRLAYFLCGAGPVLSLNPGFSLPSQVMFDPYSFKLLRKRVKTRLQRFLDDNNLSDEVWNSEMREVELWENERLDPAITPLSPTFFGASVPSNGGWSKSHLKSNDRAAWTRGRDGWSGVAVSGGDGDGTVSSNLTFSLAPNWEFVPTEDWRADLIGAWVNEGRLDEEDEDGWVYTNDVWLVPADHAYSGAVTRRRRWVRRIWYHSCGAESC